MKTIILLGAGGECVPIIQKAKDMGLRTVVVDGNGNAPGMALADVPVVKSCYHADAAIPGLRRAEIGDVGGVLCAAVDAPHVAAVIRAEFGLPGLGVEAARRSVDKYEQKKTLRSSAIPVPDFWKVAKGWKTEQYIVMGAYGNKAISGWDIHSSFEKSVIKPCDSRGARGVVILPKNPDREQTIFAILEAETQSATQHVMIEEWLDGPQYSTESIILGGKVVFTACGLRNYDRLAEFFPHSIEDGFDVPSLPPCGIDAVNELIARACAALGWLDAAPGLTVKGDLIWHDGELVVLELAARLSGGYFCSHVTPMVYGVDFVYAAIKLAMGEGVRDASRGGVGVGMGAGFVSQRYVFPDISEIGRKVVSLPRVTDWAAWATWLISPGDIIKPVVSHAARWGQACFVGGRLDEAQDMAARAVAEMKAGVVLE